jgi:hypothetical protein
MYVNVLVLHSSYLPTTGWCFTTYVKVDILFFQVGAKARADFKVCQLNIIGKYKNLRRFIK